MSGKKDDQNKPKLNLLPPSWWHQRRSANQINAAPLWAMLMAEFYFYGNETIFDYYIADPMPALEYGDGAKYQNSAWHREPLKWSRLVAAFLRHLYHAKSAEFRLEGDIDSESGVPHWSHAAANLAMLREYNQHGFGIDDRPCSVREPLAPPESLQIELNLQGCCGKSGPCDKCCENKEIPDVHSKR